MCDEKLMIPAPAGCILFSTFLILVGCSSMRPQPHQGVSSDDSIRPTKAGDPGRPSMDLDLDAQSTLSDCLRYAALHNPNLEAAFHRWKAALENVAQVKTLPDPRFNYGYFIREIETRVGPQDQRFGISQTFPWIGKLRLRGEQAGEAALAARQHYEAAKLKLFFEVKEAYFELAYLKQAVSITQENIDLVKHLEQVAQTRFRSGSDVTGVIKSQVELGSLEERLVSLQELKSPLAAKLNAALNRPPGSEVPWPETLDRSRIQFPDEVVISALTESNPELKALNAAILAEQKGLELAEKEFWPDLTLGVDYIDTGSARMANVPDSGRDPVMLTGSINLPIWRNKYLAGVREAQARMEAASQTRIDRENLLFADLKTALYQFREAQRKANLYGNTLTPLAKNSLAVAEQAYRAGSVDFLELIDDQRLLLEFQLAYQRAIADSEQTLAKIEMLIGRDIQSILEEREIAE